MLGTLFVALLIIFYSKIQEEGRELIDEILEMFFSAGKCGFHYSPLWSSPVTVARSNINVNRDRDLRISAA